MKRGYYVGPGGWLYYVHDATTVTVVWSPQTRSEINTRLSSATATSVVAELSGSSGLSVGNDMAKAIRAAQALAPSAAPAATGLTSYLPAMPGFLSSTPTTTPAPGAGAGADTGTKITDQPWFVPAVIGGLGLLAVLAFAKPSKAKAAPPSSRYAGLF